VRGVKACPLSLFGWCCENRTRDGTAVWACAKTVAKLAMRTAGNRVFLFMDRLRPQMTGCSFACMVASWTRWGLLLLTGQLKSLQPKTRVRLSPACQDSHPRGADSCRTREPPDCENVPWNPCAPLDCAGIGYFWACYRLRVNRVGVGPPRLQQRQHPRSVVCYTNGQEPAADCRWRGVGGGPKFPLRDSSPLGEATVPPSRGVCAG